MEEEKRKHHFDRLDKHVSLVKKYGSMIIDLGLDDIDNKELFKEVQKHDESKRVDPELSAYIDISWYYKMKRDGKEMELTPDLEKAMDVATKHHIKNNKHHPDYWSDDVSTDGSMRNREKVVKCIDCSKMPLTHVAHMVADWLAMGEELGNTAREWADKTVNKRWNFTPKQVDIIDTIIKSIEGV